MTFHGTSTTLPTFSRAARIWCALDASANGTAACTIGEMVPPPERRAKLNLLTERELHVLKLLGRGSTNSEIASELCVSTGTVKTHVGSILAKLGLRDRAAAIVFAFEHGLVKPGGRAEAVV